MATRTKSAGKVREAQADTVELEPVRRDRREADMRPRFVAGGLIVVLLAVVPYFLTDFRTFQITLAFIFAIAALSMNQLIGYAGQISLGHQAFFGVGAFASANVVSQFGMPFWFAVPAAAATGVIAALVLGLAALRLRGLYFALLTLAYGFMAEGTLFLLPAFTQGAAGLSAPRPAGFSSDTAYFYLVLAFWAVLLFADWRFTKSKSGRAVFAVRDDERVAAVNGINVAAHKLLIFGMAGFYAGIAGALFAHWRLQVVSNDFTFALAITFVFMVVVGGINSRAGIFIAAVIFSLLQLILGEFFPALSTWVPVIGTGLLVLTLIFYPGGIGQQIRPFVEWFRGRPFDLKHQKEHHTAIGGR